MTDLSAIKSRAEAATAGPWRVGENEWNLKCKPWSSAIPVEFYDQENAEQAVPGIACWMTRGGNAEANAQFIANAREDVASLLALVERLEAEVERLKDDHERHAIRNSKIIGALEEERDCHAQSANVNMERYIKAEAENAALLDLCQRSHDYIENMTKPEIPALCALLRAWRSPHERT